MTNFDKTQFTREEYLEKFIKPKLTPYFLGLLGEIHRSFGWSIDRYETTNFIRQISELSGFKYEDDIHSIYEFKTEEEED